jgi:hypothetical protein
MITMPGTIITSKECGNGRKQKRNGGIMRTLSYALVGIALGYGYPILIMWTEFVLKKSVEVGIWLITKMI